MEEKIILKSIKNNYNKLICKFNKTRRGGRVKNHQQKRIKLNHTFSSRSSFFHTSECLRKNLALSFFNKLNYILSGKSSLFHTSECIERALHFLINKLGRVEYLHEANTQQISSVSARLGGTKSTLHIIQKNDK